MNGLTAGAASIEISPRDSVFLFGYPHVKRFSTGVHDALLSSALYLSDGMTELIFVANDIIFVGKALAQRVRKRIEEATAVPAAHIMITATHTHSGPNTVEYASNESDPAVPPVDPTYLQFFEDRVVAAAVQAHQNTRPVQVGLAVADATGIGTNRRDPAGPTDPEVPVLAARATSGDEMVAAMVVYSMHPTVLHEDSKLISGDFPAMTRRFLQQHVFGNECPILYHTGPAGDQSLRHVTRANTFAEAERLGGLLGRAIAQVVPDIVFSSSHTLRCTQGFVNLPKKEFPAVAEAEKQLQDALKTLQHLQRTNAARQFVRTAEVNWFGAEETLTLARAAQEGRLDDSYESCLPAECQVLTTGPWSFVAWPGEIFVEHALAVKARFDNTFVISLANGELQGYIVTEDAAREGGYEAANSIFGPQSGKILVDATLTVLEAQQG
jgi:neutral ceramidase